MNYESNRNDSYSNLITGLGKKNVDKNTGIQISDEFYLLDDAYLTNLYISDGMATKVVDIVADDCIRNGWELWNDDDEKIKTELDNIGFTSVLHKALKYTRLYRGAVIIMITEFGDLEKPLSQNNGKIKQLRVYSASRIEVQPDDIITDPKSPYYDEVEYYRIRKRSGGYMVVHASRCMAFKGELIPDYETATFDITYEYWGLSALQKVYKRLGYYGAAEQGLSVLMQELVVGKYKMSNLEQILAMNNSDAINKILTRLEIMNTSKSIINAVLLGKEEDYTRDSINLSGVDKVTEYMQMNISAVSEIPITRFFGRSPAGLNATGQSDERIYYDKIKATQMYKLQKPMEQCIQYIAGYVLGTGNTADYGIKQFNSLWELTEKEKAEIDKLNAETNNIYIMTGVLTAEDVQEQEFPELNIE